MHPFADPFHQILAIGNESDSTGSLEEVEGDDRTLKGHLIVGGVGFRHPVVPADPSFGFPDLNETRGPPGVRTGLELVAET